MRVRAFAVILAVVAALFALPGDAAGAAKEVEIDCGASPGLLIDKPGAYKLKSAVANCAPTRLVEIAARDVTFDLGGRMIQGAGTCVHGVYVEKGRTSSSGTA